MVCLIREYFASLMEQGGLLTTCVFISATLLSGHFLPGTKQEINISKRM
jgi:hypothetical protein